MKLTPQEQAAAIANRIPRPLTEDEKVALGLAGPLDAKAVAKLARKYRKPETKRTAEPRSKDSNGWGR